MSKLNGTKNFSNFKVVSESGLNLVESSNQPKAEIKEHTHASELAVKTQQGERKVVIIDGLKNPRTHVNTRETLI